MLRRSPTPRPPHDVPTSRTVRVLHSDEELAQASERAAVHERRLQDRLEARAARDAWSAAHRADEASAPRGRIEPQVIGAEISSPAA